MADCCDPGSGFPNAGTMEQLSTDHPTIWSEICALQQAILAAASQCQPGGGQLCTTVGGNTPMTFITGVESVTVVNGGLGYVEDSPLVTFIPPLGSPGTGATATITTNGGNISAINITNGGTGYQPIPATMSITSGTGAGAILEPLVNTAGQIVNINIANAGTGYTLGDSVTATRAVAPNVAYVDAVFAITSVGGLGEILSVAILNPGTGYEDSITTVEIVSTLNPTVAYPTGTAFQGDVTVDNAGAVTGVIISNQGAGFGNTLPYLVITDPGTGAEAVVNISGGSVTSIDVTEPGDDYTTSATGTVYNPSTAPAPNPPATPAIVTIETATNTYGSNPELYWQVWQGAVTNRAIQLQMNSVLSYFKGLGYTIAIETNPASGDTIQWKICW